MAMKLFSVRGTTLSGMTALAFVGVLAAPFAASANNFDHTYARGGTSNTAVRARMARGTRGSLRSTELGPGPITEAAQIRVEPGPGPAHLSGRAGPAAGTVRGTARVRSGGSLTAATADNVTTWRVTATSELGTSAADYTYPARLRVQGTGAAEVESNTSTTNGARASATVRDTGHATTTARVRRGEGASTVSSRAPGAIARIGTTGEATTGATAHHVGGGTSARGAVEPTASWSSTLGVRTGPNDPGGAARVTVFTQGGATGSARTRDDRHTATGTAGAVEPGNWRTNVRADSGATFGSVSTANGVTGQATTRGKRRAVTVRW